MMSAFMVSGMGCAVFLVPMNGHLQNLAPAAERGKILAGSSVLDCSMGLLAVILQLGFYKGNLPFPVQCLIVLLLVAWAGLYTIRLIPSSLVRTVISVIFKRLYRVRATGAELIPAEGGVLLTPNHISYLDTLILSCVTPRPVRFLMVRDCFDTPGVGAFARFFDTIPISRERAKEAITKAAEALEEGTVVCIFPEGQLTRTGALSEMKRGFQMIARKAKAPVVPVYMDGLWGTRTTFEREKMFYKRPKRGVSGVRVHFGRPLEGKAEITPERLGSALHDLSAAAMSERDEVQNEGALRRAVAQSDLPTSMKAQLEAMRWEALQPLVYNATQIRELSFSRDQLKVGYEEGIPGEAVIALWAVLTRSQVWTLPAGEKPNFDEVNRCDFLFVGERMGPVKSQVRNTMIVEVNGALIAEGEMDAQFFPARVEEGLFTAMSMPHPSKISPSDPLQPGWKPQRWGRILPGAATLPEGADPEFFV